jgi:hypothetical protein
MLAAVMNLFFSGDLGWKLAAVGARIIMFYDCV